MALAHLNRFLQVSMPGCDRTTLDALSTALGALDMGTVEPIVKPVVDHRVPGPPPDAPGSRELLAMLVASVTFLVGRGSGTELEEACRTVATIASSAGFVNKNGKPFTARQIRSLKSNLGVRRSDSARKAQLISTLSMNRALLVPALRDRGRVRKSEYRTLLTHLQAANPKMSRRAVVEVAIRKLRTHLPRRIW